MTAILRTIFDQVKKNYGRILSQNLRQQQ